MIKNITIDGVKCVVGLEWEGISSHKPSSINGEIKILSKKRNKNFGCKIVKDRIEQIGFANAEHKGLLAPAVVLAKNYTDIVYFKKIDDNNYWLCVINPQGNVLPDKEGLFDFDSVVEILEELEMFGSVKILCSKKEKEDFYPEDQIEDEDGPELEFVFIEFKNIIKNSKRDSEEKIHELITQSALLKNLITFSGLSIVGFLIYYFIIQTNPLYKEIVNQEISEEIFIIDASLNSYLRANEESILSKKIIDEGKIEFLKEIESNIYTKQEIKSNITRVINLFPDFLVEWQRHSVEFKKYSDYTSAFIVNYVKINSSNGYIEQVRNELLKLSEQLKAHNVKFLINDLEGSTVSLVIEFKPQYQASSLIKSFESSDLMAKRDQSVRDFQRIKDEVSILEYRVQDEFGFFNKRFGSALSQAEDEILIQIDNARIIAEAVKNSYEEIKKQNINVEDKYFTTRTNYLNLSQQHSHYSWDRGGVVRFYPRVGVRDGGANAFASYTFFSLSSSSGMSDNLEGLQSGIELLNKEWLTIKEINFNVQNKTWNIKGEYYEKK